MDRIADLVQQLEPETTLPSGDAWARQLQALVRSMALAEDECTSSRHWRSHHKGWFVAIIGAAAVALVAAVLIPRSSPSPTPRVPTSVVLVGITRALANTGNDIEEVQSVVPGAPLSSTSWVDLSTGACRTDTSLNGQPSLTVFLERGNAVFVDYRLREWWTRSADGVTCQALTPRIIEHDLAAGRYTVAGRTTIAAKSALKLVSRSVTTGPRPVTKLTTLWVDAATYLPIRSTSIGHLVEQTAFTWLPETSTNTTTLNVTVPAGFRQVANPTTGIQSGG